MSVDVSALIDLRQRLHAHPELSGDEAETADRIVEFLEPLGPDRIVRGVGGHGIVASFDSGVPGPTLLVRTELDALPISELSATTHRSVHPGVSHMCGHDGHMAMVCGLAAHLAVKRPAMGAVHLLFQPAEETGAGAAAVLDDPAFAEFQSDLGLAIHNVPGFAMHAIVLKSGVLTPAVRSIVFRFRGRTAHASQPLLGENPTIAIGELVAAGAAMCVHDEQSDEFRLVTCVHVRVGSVAYGVSAGDGEVHFTMRAWSDDRLELLQTELVEHASARASADGLTLEWHTLEDFRSNHNDPTVTEMVASAARQAGLDVVDAPVPLVAGEDFGLFTSRFPCCMVVLGAGEDNHPIHNAYYDFPDELISTGVRLYEAVLARIHS